jgi:serine/threonine protein kinase
VDVPDDPCPECGSEPPAQGWPRIDESPYRYLGRIVEGRYVLDQFLGDGATGYVYRARALQIRRKFACKIVDTRRYNKKEFEEELLRRFRLEVDAMSQLRNPHVVAIYEAMQLYEGVFALLMDFVDGRTLQDLLDRVGRIKMNRALELMRQVAHGLYEAHRVGFIHRDLKPDNIMIERMPASGFFARILDFGIVHMMGKVDATQGFRGTPLYASPEQCMGQPGLDNRSDIYSLGCVFFHCITGQPPFPGTESLRVMDAHVNEPPPAVRDVLTRSTIPGGLEGLMRSLLAKDPDDRPEDLSVVITEIDDIIRNLNTTPPRKRIGTNPGRPPRVGNRTQAGRPVGLDERVSTGKFTPVQGDEKPGAQSSSRSQVVAPLLEFQLPDAVVDQVTAFTAVALNETGDMATVADQNNVVHVLSLKNDGEYHSLRGASGLIVSVYFDSAQRAVFASEMDGTVLRWALDEPDSPRQLGRLNERIYVLATAGDGRRVLCGTEKGRVVALEVAGDTQQVLVESGPPISALGLSTTENKLIVGYWGGKLETIHLGTGARKELEPLPKNAKSIVVSADGYLAAVLDEAGNVRILGMLDGRAYFTMQAQIAALRALAFADDGQLMGLGVLKTSLRLWELRNRPVPRT